MRRTIYLIALLKITTSIAQERIDLLTISNTSIQESLEYSNSDKDNDSSTQKAPYNFTSLRLIAPYPISEKITTGIIFDYQDTQTRLDPEYSKINLKSYKVSAMGLLDFAPKWSLLTLLKVRASSNFDSFEDSRIFQTGADIVFFHKLNDKVTIRAGAGVQTEAGGVFLYPSIGGSYISENKKLRIETLLPSFLNISYEIVPKLRIGLMNENFIESYKLTGTDKRTKTDLSKLYAEKIDSKTGVFAEVDFFKNWLTIRAEVARQSPKISLYEDTDLTTLMILSEDNRNQLNPDFSNSPTSFTLTAKIRFDTSKVLSKEKVNY